MFDPVSAVLAVECPQCAAPAGKACVVNGDAWKRPLVHVERIARAALQGAPPQAPPHPASPQEES